jgi:hypothetical protein
MSITGVVASATGVVALIGSISGGVMWMEGRYVTAAEFKNVEWALLREQMREDKIRCEENPDDEYACDDYEDSLDRFCRAFPEDRVCRK